MTNNNVFQTERLILRPFTTADDEGTLRQFKVSKGELVDRVRYAILAEDYFAN